MHSNNKTAGCTKLVEDLLHDIKTPLATILHSAELVSLTSQQDEHTDQVDRIIDCVDEIKKLMLEAESKLDSIA